MRWLILAVALILVSCLPMSIMLPTDSVLLGPLVGGVIGWWCMRGWLRGRDQEQDSHCMPPTSRIYKPGPPRDDIKEDVEQLIKDDAIMNMWIKPAGAHAWHLFNKELPASLCGLRFEGMEDGPLPAVPPGEEACEACKIAVVGQAAAAGAAMPDAMFAPIQRAVEEVVYGAIDTLFFAQHSAAALGAVLANPNSYGLVIDDNGNIDLTAAAVLAHAAAAEASRVMAGCRENHGCPGDPPPSDDGQEGSGGQTIN